MAIDIATRLLVEDLFARYVHAIDEDRLEDWPALFAERGAYRIVTADNETAGLPLPIIYCESRAMMRDRVASLRHANIYEPQRYRHVVSSTIIEPHEPGRVRALSHFIVVRIMQDGATLLFASGRYRDRIVLAGENHAPQFEERIVVCDSQQFDTLLAIPL